MGYESKLIVVEKYGFDYNSFGNAIATINLAGMPNTFFPIDKTFENELDKSIFVEGKEVIEDCYGEKLRYTSVEKLLEILHKCEGEEHYCRTEMAINLLRSFVKNPDWDNIVVVHYGY